MRTRINRINLLGGEREVHFEPGLNIIHGEITSGKTPLLQMIHGLFGHAFEHLIPELREHVSHVEGSITLGDQEYVVIRPLTTTRTAKVDVAGDEEVLRLPVLEADETSSLTYGQWLLERLRLPEIEIGSTPSPVSINDYFMYCHLRSKEIATSVFGHVNEAKNDKRIVVFQVLYGIYDVEVYQLLAHLRNLEQLLREARARGQLLERSFSGTAFANRAAVIRARDEAVARLRVLEDDITEGLTLDSGGEGAGKLPTAAQELRQQVLALDRRISGFQAAVADEETAAAQMEELVRQLQTQIRRLTKAIVADRHLLDFDFLQCPRCGSAVQQARASDDICYLCLQQPAPSLTRADLEIEQRRLDAQVVESRDLATTHLETVKHLREEIAEAERARERAAAELDFVTRSYIADSAERIRNQAAERASLREMITRYKDYLQVFDRMAETQAEADRLEKEVIEVRGRLTAAYDRQSEAGGRIQYLNRAFRRILQRFDPPQIGDREATYIDRETYLPVVDGHSFDALPSPALVAQVNVAHALAHHLTSLEFELGLPAILLIDGPARNLGNTGLSPQRKARMYEFLISVSEKFGDRLQIIVADDEVPESAEPYVRVRLTEADRLVRTAPVSEGADEAEVRSEDNPVLDEDIGSSQSR